MTTDTNGASFHWADYVIFSLSLGLGLVIGVIYLLTGGRQKTKEEYLVGGGNLNFITVGASMLASTMNAIYLLGGTAEVSYRGAIYLLLGVSYILIVLMSVFIYVPLWRKIKVITAHEYLERRYNSLFIRVWGASLFSLRAILFLSVVFYTPAMALTQVTGLNMHVAIVVCGVVCALYTVLGGMKAVVMVDTIQAFLMLLGMLVLCIMGSVRAGGTAYVFQTADQLGRLNFNNFSPDPRERHTVWTFLVGLTITWSISDLSDQVKVQRFMAVKSLRAAQGAMVVLLLIGLSALILVTMAGLIAAVYYKDCDPLYAGQISAADQLLPYFFMDVLGPYYGLPGLFISAIFAAALSTVSSSINSLTAVFLIDFLQPMMIKMGKPMLEKQEHIYAKIIAAIFGVLAIALSYLAPLLGSSLIQIPPTLMGAIGGPLFSLFFLGFFVPWANKWGAFCGSSLGLVVSLWMSLGAVLHAERLQNLPIGMCNATEDPFTTSTYSSTMYPYSAANLEEDSPPLADSLYSVSYAWLGVIGIAASILSGIVISILTNICGLGDPPGSYSTDLLSPWAIRFCTKSRNHNHVPETLSEKTSAVAKGSKDNSRLDDPTCHKSQPACNLNALTSRNINGEGASGEVIANGMNGWSKVNQAYSACQEEDNVVFSRL